MLHSHHLAITGASSGIGTALAELYAAPGVRLALQGRNAERLATVAAAAQRKGATVITKILDVTDAAAVAAWLGECDRQQPLDLVIANAGVSGGTGGGEESAEQSRTIFAANVTGVLNTVQPAITLMTKRGRGQIAIMSSLAGFRGFAGTPSYCASKAAVRVYGEAWRGELAAHGVEVNVICPGFIKTPMTDANPFPMPMMMTAERAARIIQKGLAHNRARIAFPWPIYALVRLLAALPQDWINRPMRGLPRKSPKS